MIVGVDRLTKMAAFSVRKFLADALLGSGSDYSGVWVASGEFDHENLGDGSGPRLAPYLAIVYVSERTTPFAVGNKEVTRSINLDVWVVCEDFKAALSRPQQVAQLLNTAKGNGVDGQVELFDFDASGDPSAGFLPVEVDDLVPLIDRPGIGVDEKRGRRNLGNTVIVPVRVEVEKVKEAELLT